MATIVLILSLSSIAAAQSSSLQDNTIINGWVPDPSSGRGTFSIISSCVLTLSLCVYTALHLNIKARAESIAESLLLKIKWVLIGTLAPEILLFVAWRQWVSARSLTKAVNLLKAQGQTFTDATGANDVYMNDTTHLGMKAQNTEEPRFEWTIIHSFYANMGGFIFEFDEEYAKHNKNFTSKYERLTLTPRGMKLLAECGYLPDVSKDHIMDKSKADSAAKLIALAQAVWMLIQILGRVGVRLPVTLLEVNTMAHVFCALVIYFLWWNKPKEVSQPIKLHGPWVGPLAAYMFMSSQASGWKSRNPGVLKKTWLEPEFSILAFSSLPSDRAVGHGVVTRISHESEKAPTTTTTPKTPKFDEGVEVSLGSLETPITPRPLRDLAGRKQSVSDTLTFINSHLERSATFQSARWRLASEAVERYPAVASRFKRRDTSITSNDNRIGDQISYFEPNCEELVMPSVSNWPDDSLLRDGISGFVIGVVSWSLSMIYGGLHAAAWNEYFPTAVESTLWRISCLWIAGSGGLWVLINGLASLFPAFKKVWESIEHLKTNTFFMVGLGSLAVLCGGVYVLARVFIVVEALISLRSLPAAAFDTPDWTQVIPHL